LDPAVPTAQVGVHRSGLVGCVKDRRPDGKDDGRGGSIVVVPIAARSLRYPIATPPPAWNA